MSFSNRFKVLGLLGVPLLAVAVAVLVLAWGNSTSETQAANQQAKSQVDIVITVGGSPVCNNAQQAKCTLAIGGPFVVQLVPSAIPVGGYIGWQTKLDYNGFTYIPEATAAAEMKFPAGVLPLRSHIPPVVSHGNVTGLVPPQPVTTQKTAWVNLDFTCNQANGIIELRPFDAVNEPDGTTISDGMAATIAPNVGDLEINCVTPTATNTPTNTPTATNTPTPTNTPSAPSVVKDPGMQNIFMTRQGAKIPPATCLGSTDGAVLTQSIDTKVTGTDKHGDPRQLGAFEFEVQYDEEKVCVTLVPGPTAQAWIAAGGACIIQDSVTKPTLQGVATIACNKLGKDDVSPPIAPPNNTILAGILVQPMPDDYSQGKPNNGNGFAVQLNNVGCKIADEQGDPVAPPPGAATCTDADVTIRWLEGDVEPSCEVDTADTQAIAFRWNSAKGNLLFNDRFNVEPSAPQADNDIDVLDLQFVYGRFGSTCDNPWPDQPPVNPKA